MLRLEQMVDPYTLLGMAAIVPFIETIDILMEFAQSRDVFIQDSVGALKTCELQLLKLYADSATAFKTNDHHVFRSLTQLSHYDIHMKWESGDVVNGKSGRARLAFIINGKTELAKYKGQFVDEATYAALAIRVRAECEGKFL